MKSILILGYGASGKAAEALARLLGYGVEVRADALVKSNESGCVSGGAESLPLQNKTGTAMSGGAESLPLLNKDFLKSSNCGGRDSSAPKDSSATKETPAFAVVSPGVPLTSPLIAECRARGIPLKSEMQFGCEELKRQGWKLLAVTGSKGKSSVVKVIADAINLSGMHAVACGNYGRPVSDVALESWRGKDSAAPAGEAAAPCTATAIAGDAESLPLRRWAVVEVSSFMMETTELPSDTFEAAAILNLQEDHLDRHGSVAVYHALKRKLLTMAKRQVVGGAESLPLLNKEFSTSSDSGGRDSSAPKDSSASHPVSASDIFADSYFDNDILRANARCAVALMRAAGLADATIRGAFAAFCPLPHRFERVAEIDGVEYIDDSKATSVAALVAGVTMCRRGKDSAAPAEGWRGKDSAAPVGETDASCAGAVTTGDAESLPLRSADRPFVRLIAGGLPKGDDPKIALPILTKRVKKVYLIGQCAESFAFAWKSSVDCEICGTMEAAVAAVKREAVKGDKVLLSPGTASFDQFKSFGERGEVFARLVKKEK